MARHHHHHNHNDRHRRGRYFHLTICIILLVSGIALLSTGLWLRITGGSTATSGSPLSLHYSNDSFFHIVLNPDLWCLILTSFLLLTAFTCMMTLVSCCEKRKTVRILYMIMACVLVMMLTLTCIVCAMIVAYDDRAEIRRFIEQAWETSVANDVHVVCDIEDTLTCRGFEHGQCHDCDNKRRKRRKKKKKKKIVMITVRQQQQGEKEECRDENSCAVCPPVVVNKEKQKEKEKDGCYYAIVKQFRKLFLPCAVASAVLAALVVLDMFVTWCI